MRDPRLASLHDWLRRHHGVVSRGVLEDLGFSPRSIRRLVSNGHLEPAGRGIYRAPAQPWGREQLMVAACLHVPGGAIGFTTAGQEYGFRGMTDRRVHLLVPHGCSPHVEDVVVHRCRRIDPVDLTSRRADGITLTSPPRTLHDAAAIVGVGGTESAIEQALLERRSTIETLMSTSRRLHHGNRPGSKVFEAVIGSRPVWRNAARSDLELRVRQAIEWAGLPEPDVNLPFVLPSGEAIEIDLAWPALTTAVEVDHPFWHDGSKESSRDKRRDRKLQAIGWATPRLTKEDVDFELDDAIGDLKEVLLRRGWRRGETA
jgi:hypothetical protein